MIEEPDRLLPAEEPEAGDLLAEVFGREGIDGAHRHRGPGGSATTAGRSP